MAEVAVVSSGGCRGGGGGGGAAEGEEVQDQRQQQVSLVELLLATLRKSMVACSVDGSEDVISAVQQKMEIGWPTDVQHVTHVTFDRFNGFLGLPVEFEVEIPGKVPSASASVFGVSPESMQCCYDSRGNSVPTILLLLQERLYSQGGLKAEGIFRINPENSKEEYVRDKLNKGIVPDDIDVHCLAGLIKAWFRELPAGVLDGLSPEQVLQCNTEEEFVELIELLLPTQAALLNWAVELMADVVEEEEVNKMNSRNIAMVFAPNMTQMSDPLTALMHAVQVMNLLKALVLKTLRDREDAARGDAWSFSSSPVSNQQSDVFGSLRGEYVSGEVMEQPNSDYEAYEQYREHTSDDNIDEQTSVDDHDEQASVGDHDKQTRDDSHDEQTTDEDLDEQTSDEDGDDDYNGEDETDSVKEIENCFLLEWEEEESGEQATTMSICNLHIGSGVSTSESKQGSSSFRSDEEDSEKHAVRDAEVSMSTEKKFEKAIDVEIVKL